MIRVKQEIQHNIETELDQKLFAFSHEGKVDIFDKYFAHKNVICTKLEGQEGKYEVNGLFD